MEGGLCHGRQHRRCDDPARVGVHSLPLGERLHQAFHLGVLGVEIGEAGDVQQAEARELRPGALKERFDDGARDAVQRFVGQPDPLAAKRQEVERDARVVGLPAFPNLVSFFVSSEMVKHLRRHVEAKALGRVSVDAAAVLKDCGGALRRTRIPERATHRLHVCGPEHERAEQVCEYLWQPGAEEAAEPSGVELPFRAGHVDAPG